MFTRIPRRFMVVIALLGAAGAVGATVVPSAKAAGSAPVIFAALTGNSGTYQLTLSGSGFTAGSTVKVAIFNASTGTVLATVPVQASSTTAQVSYVTSAVPVCTAVTTMVPASGTQPLGGTAPGSGQQAPGGASTGAAPVNAQQAPVRTVAQTTQVCRYQTLTEPQVFYTGGGTVSLVTSVALSDYPAQVTVMAVDTATNTWSNSLTLTIS